MENFRIDADDSIYEDDPVAKAAHDNFGIRYLFPWQRMVIANIMESYDSIRKNDGNMQSAEQADDDAQNRHGAVAFTEADGRI